MEPSSPTDIIKSCDPIFVSHHSKMRHDTQRNRTHHKYYLYTVSTVLALISHFQAKQLSAKMYIN
jgi:hypothetical protein